MTEASLSSLPLLSQRGRSVTDIHLPEELRAKGCMMSPENIPYSAKAAAIALWSERKPVAAPSEYIIKQGRE